jgi:hypothetical protein
VAHRADTAVPAIEIANDADAPSAGRPDGKMSAGDSVDGSDVSAELFVCVVVPAFAHEVQIELGELEGESVGVVALEFFAVFGDVTEAIAGRGGSEFAHAGKHGLEESGVYLAHGKGIWSSVQEELGIDGAGLEKANGPAASFGRVDGVRTQNTKRIAVAGAQQRVNALAEGVGWWRFRGTGIRLWHGSILAEERWRNHWGERGCVGRDRFLWVICLVASDATCRSGFPGLECSGFRDFK